MGMLIKLLPNTCPVKKLEKKIYDFLYFISQIITVVHNRLPFLITHFCNSFKKQFSQVVFGVGTI